MSKQETVEVTLRLPKALVDFIRTMEGDDGVPSHQGHSLRYEGAGT